MNPLWPLLLIFLITIQLSLLVFWLTKTLILQNRNSTLELNRQVNDLLNRLMTIKWENFQVLTSSQSNQILPQDGEGIGLSDENEMRKYAEMLGVNYPIGETFVETGLDEYDREQLGLDLP